MSRTVPAKSNTPGAWATAWALQQPSFTGILQVESLTRAGRFGRRGARPRINAFYVSGGCAAPRREIKAGPNYPAGTSPFINGMCERCGKLYRNCILRAGWHGSLDNISAPIRWLWACPACYVVAGLCESHLFQATLDRRSPLARHHVSELPVAILNIAGPEPITTMPASGGLPADRARLDSVVPA